MNMNRIRQGFLFLAFLAIALFSGSDSLVAQTSTQGSIAGTVMDPTGSAVSGAAVTIHNAGTNAEIKLTADASGFFKAPLLEPGTYTVSVSMTGFAAYRADNVLVLVGQVTTILPHLTVAGSSAEVVVTEQAPVLNMESPDFSATLNQAAMQSIPINNRRWSSLAMTTPGAVSDGNGYGLVSIRGVSPLLNNVEIDGADDNQAFFAEERGRTREAYSTAGAAVREFAVNTGVYSAEYGRAAGGVITSVTSSGTNQLHGQAYFWDRESNWNAYNNYTTVTELVNGANTVVHIKPEDLRKIYGFTAGGALIKDKLFWIYTYDQHTHVFPVIGVPNSPSLFNTLPLLAANLPTGAVCSAVGYLSGDSSSTTQASIDAQACTLAARQKISYNQAAIDWANLMFGGTVTNGAATPQAFTDLGLNSDIGQVSRFGYQEINTPKLDYQINPKEHVSVLYHRLRWDSPGGVQTAPSDKDARDYQGNDFVKLDYGVAKLTSLIKNNISNELLYQYGRELNDESQQPLTAYTKADLVTANGNIPQVAIATGQGGFSAGSPYYSYRVAYPYETKWQVGDVLYWNKGNHTLKFGVDMVHNYDLMNNTYESNGVFTYSYFGNYMNDEMNFRNGITPSATNNLGCNQSSSENGVATTNAGANAIWGAYPCTSSYAQGFGNPVYAIATTDSGVFAQDNWKFSPRLTLELGLRWDYESMPPADPNLTAVNATSGPNFYAYPGLTNNPTDKKNFGPRVGFSYDLTGKGKTVLRGGYGFYYGRVTNGNLLQVRLGTGSANGQITPAFKNTTTVGPQFPNTFAAGSPSALPTSYFLAPNLRDPQVQEFDLAVQQAIGKGTYVQLSYLGALGRELPNFLNLNLDPTTVTTETVTVEDLTGNGPLGATGKVLQIPTYTAYGNKALFGANAANFQNITEVISNVNSSYNAMVVEVLNRSLHSLQFDANYTWSHALDFSQNASTQGSTNSWFDPYSNPRINYGNSNYNVPNRFVAYALYKFPNLHTNNLVKYLSNDWSLNDSFQMQNGLPWTFGVGGSVHAAISSDWNGSGGSSVIPGVGINTMKYPRKIVDDVRLQKQVTFDKGRNLQLMLNVFNVANHQNYDGYAGTTAYSLSSVSCGTGCYNNYAQFNLAGASNATYPTSSSNSLGVLNSSNNSSFLYTPRQVEIAARFTF
jgi:outer membrane receptor protein involved in Fe transport